MDESIQSTKHLERILDLLADMLLKHIYSQSESTEVDDLSSSLNSVQKRTPSDYQSK